VFVVVSVAVIVLLPKLAPWFFSRYGDRVIEPEIKLVFAILTPFFFLRGGMNVSLGAVFANLGILAVLAAAKLLPKLELVLPPARRYAPQHAPFMTLLMSTGLTFGTISSLYGLQAHIIDRTQFSLLVTVVVLSAIVPTAIAQRWFSPDLDAERAHDTRAGAQKGSRPGLTEPVPAPEGATR
jgi:Kef-type K+ transport system membrane component KefB